MRKNLFACILMLLFVITTGCNDDTPNTKEADYEVIPLAEQVGSDFTKTNKVEVLFGDGKQLLIDNKEDIDKISKQLKLINIEKYPSEAGPGYLYDLEIHEDDQTIRISNVINIEGESYKPVGHEIIELNTIVIELGRKQFSDLLPGIDI